MIAPIAAVPGTEVDPGERGAYVGADRRALRYRVIRAFPERGALLYLHGIESHGGWFVPAALGLSRCGFTTWLLDRRGSGLNRAEAPGDARSAAQLLEDVRRFRAHAGLEEVVLVGLSWGGKLALAAALDQPAGVRAIVLVTPAIETRIGFSRGRKLAIALDRALGGRARFHVPIEPEMFTRTPRFLDYIVRDPLRLEEVTSRFLFATRSLDRRIRARAARLAVPVLCLLAGRDRILDNERTRAVLARLAAGGLRVRVYEDSTHSIQFDDTDRLVGDVAAFLAEAGC